MSDPEVRYVVDQGWRPALCLRGTKYASCVIADSTSISVLRVPLREFEAYPRVPHHLGGPYSPLKAAERFLAASRRRHQRLTATREAMRIIRITLGLPPDPEPPPPEDPPGDTGAKDEPAVRRSNGPLRDICAELSIEPATARRMLRAAGLRAPYGDVPAIRRVLTPSN